VLRIETHKRAPLDPKFFSRENFIDALAQMSNSLSTRRHHASALRKSDRRWQGRDADNGLLPPLMAGAENGFRRQLVELQAEADVGTVARVAVF
jgi:hypothetical protein